jgi:hypothetical protein
MLPLEGYAQTTDGQWKLTANHTIAGVTPTMIDWWWDSIDSTDRYRLWHPTDHISFEWLIPPTQQGHVGAMHRVQEYFNGTPAEGPVTLDIRWEDAAQAPAEYSHILLATGTGVHNHALDATLMHEYEAMEGGTRMRSHFWFPAHAPESALQALYHHNQQEMAHFSAFLPWLYRAEVELPQGKGYFTLGEQRITTERVTDSSGQTYMRYRLWDNWQEQVSHLTSSSGRVLLESQHLDVTQWTWHAVEEGEHS